MTRKNLSILAFFTVVLGQASLLTWLFPTAAAEILNQVAIQETSVTVASVIQQEDNHGTEPETIPGTPLEVPNSPEQPAEPASDLMLGDRPVMIQLRQDGSHASVIVNDVEVVKFREEVAGIAPATRAEILADRLKRFIQDAGGQADQIKPGKLGSLVVIRMGVEVLATVDARNAKAAGLSREQLALAWSNRIRESLGGTMLSAKECPDLFPAPDGRFVATGNKQTGMASWYGPQFHGRRTASGSRFNMHALTAAHRSLPFGTLVRVVNHRTKKSCVVKITDRGPYAHGRIIDLSKGAAQAIGLLGSGVGRVTIEVVKPSS